MLDWENCGSLIDIGSFQPWTTSEIVRPDPDGMAAYLAFARYVCQVVRLLVENKINKTWLA